MTRLVGLLTGLALLISHPALAQLGIRTAVTEGAQSRRAVSAEKEAEIREALRKAKPTTETELREVLEGSGVADEEISSAELVDMLALSPAETTSRIAAKLNMKPSTCLGLFPTRTLGEAQCFWRQASLGTLRSARILGAEDRSTAALEIVSGLMGPVRFDVSTSLTSGEADTPEEDADRRIQQLLASGGNFSIRAMYPLLGSELTYGNVSSVFYGRAGAIFEWLGQELSEGHAELGKTDASLEAGLDSDLEFATENGEITFSFFGRVAAVHGTAPFHAAIGNADHNLFLLANLGAGIRLNKLVTVSLSGRWFALDDSIPSTGPMVSLILTPAPHEAE